MGKGVRLPNLQSPGNRNHMLRYEYKRTRNRYAANNNNRASLPTIKGDTGARPLLAQHV